MVAVNHMSAPIADDDPVLRIAARPAAQVAALIAIALLAFASWAHLAILDPTNVGWMLRGQDIGVNGLGMAAYLRVGEWPGTRQTLLASPEGLTLLFTDSNPLLGLLLWPIAGWLPPGVQVIGWWLFACLVLHVCFAWLLVRRVAPDFPTAWLGTALLTLLPTLYNRLPHANLCAHWLILFALWIFIDPARARRPGWWGAVLVLAALVHVYLLLMVAAIWGSALLAAFFDRREWAARARLIVGHAVVAALIGGVMALNGVFAGHFLSTGTFGAFPMAIDAIVNPANPSFTALLPSTPDNQGRGFEGLQYLGAGLLLLVIVAIVTAARVSAPAPTGGTLNRLRWLIPAFVVLIILALGNQVWFHGRPVLFVRLSPWAVDALDPLRASGRFFWPVAYTMVFAALLVVYRLERSRVLLLLGAALALQVIDMRPMLVAIRTLTAAADDRRDYVRTIDPRWQALVARASAIEFHPPENFRDLQLLEEISWRAVIACRPTRFLYASRQSRATQARLAADVAALAKGRIDATRLYVLFDPNVVPVRLRGLIRVIDGVSIIPPREPAPPRTRC